MTTIRKALHETRSALASTSTDSPRLEAELLLCEAAGIDRATIIAWPERTLEPAQAARLQALLERRLAGEPMAYILGRREFWGLAFGVGPGVLIPRTDTELLVELTLAVLSADLPLVCADLGSGSGAVACALAHERRRWRLIGIERSPDALAIAAANAERLQLDNLRLLRGDWLAAIARNSLDAIVANPPYVCDGDPHLRQGDLRFEPSAALAAGHDGLDAIRIIVGQAPLCLRRPGWLAVEHGWDQGEPVRGLLEQAGFEQIRTHRDLTGHERVTCGFA